MKPINTKLLILSALFTALTAIGAFIKIPMLPVPISLQTFFVLLAGIILGPYYGALSQVVYLIIGLIGLPVFTQGGGLMYILQPTFGYLAAFPFAAGIVGFLSNHVRGNKSSGLLNKNLFLFMIINTIGIIIIFLIGVVYLYVNLNYITGKGISFQNALVGGALIFLPGDVLKIFLVSVIAQKAGKIVGIIKV